MIKSETAMFESTKLVLTLDLCSELTTNKTGTSKVGAISKAQKAQDFFEKKT